MARSAQPPGCPLDWQPPSETGVRTESDGGGGRDSFFGAGLVSALAAANG